MKYAYMVYCVFWVHYDKQLEKFLLGHCVGSEKCQSQIKI